MKQYNKPGTLETLPASMRFGKASQNTTYVQLFVVEIQINLQPRKRTVII
jgi:hypothetical protein